MAELAIRPEWQRELLSKLEVIKDMARNGGPEHGTPLSFHVMYLLTAKIS